MASVADQFTDEQIDEIKEAFNLFDRNNDGNVLIAQLVTLFKMLGVHTTEAEIKVMDRTFYTKYQPDNRCTLMRDWMKMVTMTVQLLISRSS